MLDSGSQTDVFGQTYTRIAVLYSWPRQLDAFSGVLKQLSVDDTGLLLACVAIERFRVPSGLHLPYRRMALAEARSITAERVVLAEATAKEAIESLAPPGWQTAIEALISQTGDSLADALAMNRIELLVSEADGRAEQARAAATKASCALLLLPVSTVNVPNQNVESASRLQRVLHG